MAFRSREKYRGSQSVNTRVVVENLTVELYPWDEEMGQCPMNVSEFKVYMWSSDLKKKKITDSIDMYSVHTTFEVPDIFPRLLGCFIF